MMRLSILSGLAVPAFGCALLFSSAPVVADDFSTFLKPLMEENCTRCHGEKGKVKGKVDLLKMSSKAKLMAKPELIKEMYDAIDAWEMV